MAAVVFDLDGTLVDSRPDLAAAVNGLRAELGLPAVPLATVGDWIGEGARKLVERALAELTGPLPGDALPRFLAAYEPIATRETRPYPGIPELLEELRRTVPLALLTNKPERMTRAIVARAGWEEFFPVLVAGDTLPFRKPDPRTLGEISQRLGCRVAQLLLVGDSRIDMATAAAAGSSFVWVEWGYARSEDRAVLAAGPRAATAPELSRVVAARLAG